MILELILTPVFMLIDGLIGLLPSMPDLPNWISNTLDLVSMALLIFPLPIWVLSIGSITFWTFQQLIWSGIMWVVRKIPGIS